MSIYKVTYDTIDRELNKVVELGDHLEVVQTALKLSFYVAMVDAAKDDPMDDDEDQQELLTFFNDQIKELTLRYQRLVNDLI